MAFSRQIVDARRQSLGTECKSIRTVKVQVTIEKTGHQAGTGNHPPYNRPGGPRSQIPDATFSKPRPPFSTNRASKPYFTTDLVGPNVPSKDVSFEIDNDRQDGFQFELPMISQYHLKLEKSLLSAQCLPTESSPSLTFFCEPDLSVAPALAVLV